MNKKNSILLTLITLAAVVGCGEATTTTIAPSSTSILGPTPTTITTSEPPKEITKDDYIAALNNLSKATAFEWKQKQYSVNNSVENAYRLNVARAENKLYKDSVYEAKTYRQSSTDATFTSDGALSEETLDRTFNAYEKDGKFYSVSGSKYSNQATIFEIDIAHSKKAIETYFAKAATLACSAIEDPINNAGSLWSNIKLEETDFTEEIIKNVDGSTSYQFNASVDYYGHYGPSDFAIDISLNAEKGVDVLYYSRTTYKDDNRDKISTKEVVTFSNFGFGDNGEATFISLDGAYITSREGFDMSTIADQVDESGNLSAAAAVTLLKNMGSLAAPATEFEYKQIAKDGPKVGVDVDFENQDASATYTDAKVDNIVEKGTVYSNNFAKVEGIAIKDVYVSDSNFNQLKLGTFSENYTKTISYDDLRCSFEVTDSNSLVDVVTAQTGGVDFFAFQGGTIQFYYNTVTSAIGANRAISDFGFMSVTETQIKSATVYMYENKIESVSIKAEVPSFGSYYTNYSVEFGYNKVNKISTDSCTWSGNFYKEYRFSYEEPTEYVK